MSDEKAKLKNENMETLVHIAALIVSEYLEKQASKEEGEEDRRKDRAPDPDPLIVEN